MECDPFLWGSAQNSPCRDKGNLAAVAGNLVLHFPYDPDARSFRGKWYFLTTFLMAGMLGGGICVLMHTVLCRYISRAKENRYLRGICTLTVLFLTFQTFVSPVLALYWYNGSLHYVFHGGCSVLCSVCAALPGNIGTEIKENPLDDPFCRSVRTVRRGKPVDRLTVGDPDRTADGMGVFPEKKNRFWFLLPFICSLAGFAFNVLAPGN